METSAKSITKLTLLSIFYFPFSHAGLCEDNSDICRLHTGTYTDHDSNVMKWWAFEPIGDYACPEDGCPLYVWVDGTEQEPYQTKPDQYYMLEMVSYLIIFCDFDITFRFFHFYFNIFMKPCFTCP